MNVLETAPTHADSLPQKTDDWNRYLELAVRSILWIYLASLPFRALLVIERNGFILLLALLLLWSLSSRRLFYHPTPLDISLFAFVGWVALTIPFAQFPSYSLKEFGKLLQCIAVFYAVLYFLRSETSRRCLVYLFVGLTGLISLYGLVQYDPLNQQVMTSFLPSEVWLTTYLVLYMPLCFAAAYGEKQPWLRGLGVAVGIAGTACLVLTRSRAGSVALVVELLLLMWLFRRWKGAFIGLIVALFLIGGLWFISLTKGVIPGDGGEVIPMNKNTSSIVHRLDIWKFSLAEIQRHPLVGIGYGNNSFLLLYGDTPEKVEAGHAAVRQSGTHNILLYHALHTGIPGAILFVWIIFRAVKTLVLGVKESASDCSYGVLTGVLVAIVGGLVRFQFDLMFVGTLAVLFWTLLAIGIAHLPQRMESDVHEPLSR